MKIIFFGEEEEEEREDGISAFPFKGRERELRRA